MEFNIHFSKSSKYDVSVLKRVQLKSLRNSLNCLHGAELVITPKDIHYFHRILSEYLLKPYPKESIDDEWPRV